MSDYELEELAEKLTLDDLEKLYEKVNEIENKWNSVSPGLHFVVPGGWDNDLYHHEIIEVLKEERILVCIDHSISGSSIVNIHYLPSELYTLEEFNEKYK